MVSVTCRAEDCNAKVSITADVCPECGISDPAGTYKFTKTGKGKLAISFLIVFFIIMALFLLYVSNMSS